ncbi:MAG: IS1182 family transposase, partial [Ottowia sp.]|nr:IS1182 family transposase [Ottowia sp.]
MSIRQETAHAGTDALFTDLAEPSAEQLLQATQDRRQARQAQGAVRLLEPNRQQVELRASDLESLLPEGHRARLVWGYVERQRLDRLIDAVKARGSNAGRAAIDPRILFALWLYATLQGVGSGRELARLCQAHDAYRWICGGVSVNYHALNDFRAGNEALMDELLSDNVAALAAAGAISLQRVAQDGMRVRAAAGAASFRRGASLQPHLGQARALVQTLKAQARVDPGRERRQREAARLRAARERQQRIEAALAQLPEVQAVKKRNGSKAPARVSTTDAQARVMKMGDGGFRPAYNVQFASTCQDQVIVGVDVVNIGSDMAQLAPMARQVHARVGRHPDQWLVDGGFAAHEQIEAVAQNTEVYAPVPGTKASTANKAGVTGKPDSTSEPDNKAQDKHKSQDKRRAKAGDSQMIADWRERMATDEAQKIYKQRAATAECVNALARNRGMQRLPVRGLGRVKSVVGLFVLAHNLLRMAKLAPELIGWGGGASAIGPGAAQ